MAGDIGLSSMFHAVHFSFKRYKHHITRYSVGIFIFAIAIFSTSLIYTLLQSVKVQPLPFPLSDRHIILWETNPTLQLGTDELPVSTATYMAWRTQLQSLEQLELVGADSVTVGLPGSLETVDAIFTTSGLFRLLDIIPHQGRLFVQGDAEPDSEDVVVLSYELWLSRYAGRPDAIGEYLFIDERPYRILGIATKNFNFPKSQDGIPWLKSHADLWLPKKLTSHDLTDYGNHNYIVMGKLKEGYDLSDLESELEALYTELGEVLPDIYKQWKVLARPLLSQVIGELKPALDVLLVAALLLTAMAVVNLSSLLVTQYRTRHKEYAIQCALGKIEREIFWSQVKEGTIVAAIGGVIGMFAILPLYDSVRLQLGKIYPGFQHAYLQGVPLLTAIILVFGTSIITGVIAAIATPKIELGRALKSQMNVLLSSGVGIFRHGFVMLQVALAVILILLAILLGADLRSKLNATLGFDIRGLYATSLDLPTAHYSGHAERMQFISNLLTSLENPASVVAVSVASNPPLAGDTSYRAFNTEGDYTEEPVALVSVVSESFFNTLSIPLVAGRAFTRSDDLLNEPVAIVNEELAQRYFSGKNPIHQKIRFKGEGDDIVWMRIIGVVKDIRNNIEKSDTTPAIYTPIRQSDVQRLWVVVRAGNGGVGLGDGFGNTLGDQVEAYLRGNQTIEISELVRNTIRAAKETQPVGRVITYGAIVNDSLSRQKVSVLAVFAFTFSAILLSGAGIYGTLNLFVLSHRREFSIKLALGAQPAHILLQATKISAIVGFGGLVVGYLFAPFLLSLIPGLGMPKVVTLVSAVCFTLVLIIVLLVITSLLPILKAVNTSPAILLQGGEVE